MATPEADVRITPALVTELLRQAPTHLRLSAEYLTHGWDNELWRLGMHHAVRLPRRQEAVPLLRNEIKWLDRVAAPVPVATPVPVFAGAPGAGYPYPWSIVPWFAGVPATAFSVAERDTFAVQFAQVLRALHTAAPAEAPVNPYRGVQFAERAPAAIGRLRAHSSTQPLLSLVRDALDAPAYASPPRWLHGDPHPANVLIDGGRLSALIDFGDLCQGDPASDLGVAWLHFTRDGRERFFGAYGADDATRRRARGWAVNLAAAIRITDPSHPLRHCAEHAIAELLAEV